MARATLIAYPGTRVATIPDVHPARRALLVAWLADEVNRRRDDHQAPMPPEIITFLLRCLGPDHMVPERQQGTFAEYISALSIADATEEAHSWRMVEPLYLIGGDEAAEAFKEEARGQTAGLLYQIVNGDSDRGNAS